MRTDYFAELAELLKNTGNQGNQGNHNRNSLSSNDLSSYPTVTQTANDWVTRVTDNAAANDADSAVTQVTHGLPEWVTEGNQKKPLSNQHLSAPLPKLPKLLEKTDNSATQSYRLNIDGRAQLVWLAPDLEPAEALRQAQALYPTARVTDEPPPHGWPRLDDLQPSPRQADGHTRTPAGRHPASPPVAAEGPQGRYRPRV